MQIFRTGDKYHSTGWNTGGEDAFEDEVEVELVPDPINNSSAPHHSEAENGRSGFGTNGHSHNVSASNMRADVLEGGEAPGGPGKHVDFRSLKDFSWETARHHRGLLWALLAGAAAMVLVVGLLVFKLEDSSGRITSSPSSACSYAGALIPEELVVPQEYNLSVHLSWGHFLTVRGKAAPTLFAATSTATFKALRATKCIVLHSQGLNYSEVSITVNDKEEKCLCGTAAGCGTKDCTSVISPAKDATGLWSHHGMAIVKLGHQVESGDTFTLSTLYTAPLGTHENGLYRSWGFPYGSETANLISTQFKESWARQVLPCLDEPQFRATFNLAVEVPPPMVALSTMPVKARSPTQRGLMLVTFYTTPPMATYMLSFCGGRLHGRSVIADGTVNITAWGPPSLEDIGEANLALDVAKVAYEFYAGYTGITLPLPKMDMVAVPGRRHAEPHWGLAMFDDRRFLFNRASEGAYDEFLTANVICHHMALQWFGGYVSPATWANYAIADGVAGLLAYECMEKAQPQLNGRALFQIATSPMGQAIGPHEGPQTQALQLAGDPLARPLVPADGQSPMPALGTAGGAALFAMLQDYSDKTTPGGFQAGLQLFLQRHALSSASMVQLTQAIAEALLTRGLQVHLPPPLCLDTCMQTRKAGAKGVPDQTLVDAASTLMNPYFSSSGYPTVFAAADSTERGVINLSQKRFKAWSPPSDANKPEDPPHWWMPLALGEFVAAQVSGAPQVQYTELARPEGSVKLPAKEEALVATRSWLTKRGGLGLYRATYDQAQMTALTATLQHLSADFHKDGSITAASLGRLLDASALLDDSFAEMLSATAYKWESTLRLAEAAVQSPAARTGFGQYLLLLPVINGLDALRLRLRDNATCIASLNGFIIKILSTAADAILAVESKGSDGTQNAFLGTLAKSKILITAALAGDSKIADDLCGIYADPKNTLHHHRGQLTGGVPLDIRGASYIVAMAGPPGCESSDSSTMLHLDEQRWRQRVDEREDLRYLYAMPYVSNATALTEVLQVALHIGSPLPKVAEPEDALQVLHLVAANPLGGEVAWKFITDNWPTLIYEQGWPLYRAIAALPLPSTAAQLKQVRSFFAAGGPGQAAPQVVKDHLLGRLAAEVAWVNEYELGMCTFLAGETRRTSG